MVLLRKSVECSAKIAMTTLHRGRGAMCLCQFTIRHGSFFLMLAV